MDGVIHFQFNEPPLKAKITTYKVPDDNYKWDWIESRGEILCVIDCADGLVVVVKEHKDE